MAAVTGPWRSPQDGLLESTLAVASPVGALRVSVVDDAPSLLRQQMEAFVRDGFRARFGAEVSSFMPQLLGATDACGALRGVLGFRVGGMEPLFLEQYLNAPVEAALGTWVGERIERSRILEAGNLITEPPVIAPAFFQAFLVWITSSIRCDWLVFTGTRAVRTLLTRLGAEMLEIAVASPERLRQASEAWGDYYRHQPCVVAVSIAALMPLLDPTLFDPVQLRAWIDRGLELRR